MLGSGMIRRASWGGGSLEAGDAIFGSATSSLASPSGLAGDGAFTSLSSALTATSFGSVSSAAVGMVESNSSRQRGAVQFFQYVDGD